MSHRVVFPRQSEWLVTDSTKVITVVHLEAEIFRQRLMKLLEERLAE